MSAKKVFVVTVSLDVDMFVVAEDEDEAEEVAREHVSDEIDAYDLEHVASFSARGVDQASSRFENAIPWGFGEDDEEKTVAELLAEQAEAEREAEAAREADRKQIKFPWGDKPENEGA